MGSTKQNKEVAKCMKFVWKKKITLEINKQKRLAALELYKGVYAYEKNSKK